MKLVESSRNRRVAIWLLLLLLAAAGVFQASRLPSAIFPSVTFPLVKVIADVGEAPAKQVMPSVTRPLEEALLRVPGVSLVRSTTSRGSVELAAQFSWGTDMQAALQRSEAEMQRVRPDLPPQTRIDVQWMNPAVFPILGYALTSDSATQFQLRELADYTLKPELFRIPGVARIVVSGGRQREFQIQLDRAALESRHLAPGDVVTAIRANHQILSAGLTEANHELYLTLVDGRADSIDALRKLAVPVPNGVPATLGDLGKVDVADQVSYVRTTSENKPAVLVNVIRQADANTVAIAKAVDDLFRSRPELLPKGVQWTTFYDQARYVSDSIAGVRDAILIGVVLAGLVLLLFLRSLRLTAVAVIAIPLCVAIVALGLGLLGQTLNLMTLAGVAAALGLIADDAIVVIENIHRHIERGAGGIELVDHRHLPAVRASHRRGGRFFQAARIDDGPRPRGLVRHRGFRGSRVAASCVQAGGPRSARAASPEAPPARHLRSPGEGIPRDGAVLPAPRKRRRPRDRAPHRSRLPALQPDRHRFPAQHG